MAKDVDPRRLESIAMLLAAGHYTLDEISDVSGTPPASIASLKESPAFQARIHRYSDRFLPPAADDSLAVQLADDAPTNLQFIRDVRSGKIPFDESTRARLRAAELLFDRQVPKKTDHAKDGSPKVIIHLDANRLHLLRTTMTEASQRKMIDVEAAPVLKKKPA